MDTLFAWALLLFAPLVFAYAGSSDLFSMRISNRLALIFLLPFPLFAYGIGLTWLEGLSHLGVGLVTLAVYYFFWARGWIGGGDAKFAAVAVIWMGPELSLLFFALSSIYGALMAVFFMSFRANMLPVFIMKMDWAWRLHSVKRIPYGVALSIAGLQLYAASDWMQTGIQLALS
ncbi:A24 family peptidase [Cohaesibacter celericrescens]|uniref:Peptidase n=1 Tax=Cohaesibacter celericrescens TaxID=2067669 RepID=A0A2N5XMW6_9HYPH|nr:prepilin peptidase [Cohaesibacter celericrescens]PLW75832.1 peptidase [Cohaesibacter celericrescens]